MNDADSRLVTTEGDAALAIQQAKYSHSTVLVTHGDVDAVGWGAEEGHLVFLALQDEDLDKPTQRRPPVEHPKTSEERFYFLILIQLLKTL